MTSAILGIDIGTTTICGVAVRASGELIASVERPNDATVSNLPMGRAEQEPRRIRERVWEVLGELRSRMPDKIAAIGFTGQMHGMLCVDAANQPVTRLVTWQDGRCLEQSNDGGTWLEQMRVRAQAGEGANARPWETCGCEPASGFMGSTLYWICRNAALPTSTVRACFIHDWIASQLAGTLPVTDPSDAGSAGIFNLAELRWDQRIIRALDLPTEVLPPVRDSGEPIGTITKDAADATGLPAGTPVCNALGDNQASVIGSIADVQQSVLVNLGTGGQISWAVNSFQRAAGMETRYLPRGRFMLVGASLCGGRAYAWLNDVVRNWLSEFGCPVDRDAVYAKLNALADASGNGGLRVQTTFAGTRTEPGLRGSIDGIGLDNFSLGEVARAVLTGMVDELCSMYQQAGGNGHSITIASGNAVRKNPLLVKIISEKTGCPVRIPQHREEAAFGAALLAGVSMGTWCDLAEAGRVIRYI